MLQHKDGLQKLARQFVDLGGVLDVDEVTKKTMSTLPPSFIHFKAVWENIPAAECTIELLRDRLELVKDDNKHIHLNQKSPIDSAFFAAQNGMARAYAQAANTPKPPVNDGPGPSNWNPAQSLLHPQAFTEKSQKVQQCFRCGKPGHIARDCLSAATGSVGCGSGGGKRVVEAEVVAVVDEEGMQGEPRNQDCSANTVTATTTSRSFAGLD